MYGMISIFLKSHTLGDFLNGIRSSHVHVALECNLPTYLGVNHGAAPSVVPVL